MFGQRERENRRIAASQQLWSTIVTTWYLWYAHHVVRVEEFFVTLNGHASPPSNQLEYRYLPHTNTRPRVMFISAAGRTCDPKHVDLQHLRVHTSTCWYLLARLVCCRNGAVALPPLVAHPWTPHPPEMSFGTDHDLEHPKFGTDVDLLCNDIHR